MHASSETIGAIASALAKAQSELSNPEKALVGTLPSRIPRDNERTFRYASLASGLDIIRKSLGQHEIATMQTTSIDGATGQIQLTTMLAHASGEWISSVWPVCAVSDIAVPQRMGTALTYARRYALFALVGIAGEDDLDAPDTPVPDSRPAAPPQKTAPKRTVHRPPVLNRELSHELSEKLIEEIGGINSSEDLASWAHRRLPAKNSLIETDARRVEVAYQEILLSSQAEVSEINDIDNTNSVGGPNDVPEHLSRTEKESDPSVAASVLPITKTVRRRNKAHLAFVAAQPCLVCQRSPCDAHHLKFAQIKALGRKVSDEFTVPLCREHHNALHREGNEMAWWANLSITPLTLAREFWRTSPTHHKLQSKNNSVDARSADANAVHPSANEMARPS